MSAGWDQAAKLCLDYSLRPTKADLLFNRIEDTISSDERRYCQFLFLGVIRHLRKIDFAIDSLVKRRPRPQLMALLRLSTFEIMSKTKEEFPKIVDFSVEQAKRALSAKEAGLVNAVLRKIPAQIEVALKQPSSIAQSHPDWLVERWRNQHGAENTEKLLEWNQGIPQVYLRWLGPAGQQPAELQETPWEHFFTVGKGDWSSIEPLIKSGRIYIQDPGTRLAPELLEVKPGESVLDLCAAPGGKSAYLIQALGQDKKGCLVALEKPGPRIEQLDQNLRKFNDDSGPEIHLVAKDLLEATPEELGKFDAVLLDAPCSNTGVLQRRPDTKWRLESNSIQEMATLQRKLLLKASEFVRRGGRLVYSTCSIESEENEGVAKAFASKNKQFELTDFRQSYPWETNHDGAGVFKFVRN